MLIAESTSSDIGVILLANFFTKSFRQ